MEDRERELTLERDFLLRVLELGHHDDVAALVSEALEVIVDLSGARHGYIELAPTVGGSEIGFFALHGGLEREAVRELLSSTIMEASRREGIIVTQVAHADPRFEGAHSIRRHQIDAVICAPIGEPPLGVVYLQGAPNRGGQGFAPHVARLVALFARHLAPVAQRLVRRPGTDPTAPWRERLVGHEALVGRSAALAELFKQVVAAARVDLTLLIRGPSGSGKTTVARLVHDNGARRDRPFVVVSCANLPGPLFESELFGAARGAHSTAYQRMPGKVSAAEGGTLFLDEVAELTLEAQAKLLQFIETKTYSPLGDPQVRRGDVRVIVATHADLAQRVADGTFRADLFYRLTAELTVPPLEARRGDIGLIAEAALASFLADEALPHMTLSGPALHALERADWPGHIRELKNTITRGALSALADELAVIEAHHLFPGHVGRAETSFQQSMRHHQRELIASALQAHGGNVTQTARSLGMGRSSLYQLVKTLGLRV